MASTDSPPHALPKQRMSFVIETDTWEWLPTQHAFLNACKGVDEKGRPNVGGPDWMKAARLLNEYPKLINVQPKGRWSALHQALYQGNADAVRFFLSFGADSELKTCRQGEDPMTPLAFLDKLANPDDPDWGDCWQHVQDRADLHREIKTLITSHAIPPRAVAIAHSYRVAMSAGTLDSDAVDELRSQWIQLDPTMSLLDDVVDLINQHYEEERHKFIKEIDFVIFQWVLKTEIMMPLVKRIPMEDSSKSKPTLGHILCWPFLTCAHDVRHALDDMKPPKDVTSKINLTRLDWIASMLPIWDGGDVRAAFQLLAFARVIRPKVASLIGVKAANWLCGEEANRQQALGEREKVPTRATLTRSSTRPIEAFAKHWNDSFTLYATMLVCALVSKMVDCYTAYSSFCTMFTVFSPWASKFNKICDVLWTIALVWLTGVAHTYCHAMQPRIPMLSVRVHRKLIQRTRLSSADYTGWDWQGAPSLDKLEDERPQREHPHSD